jgi:dTDP-4-dehydrorhamnose reductase
MKVWITGASGLAGKAVTAALGKSYDVISSGFTRTSDKIQAVDITSEEAVENFFKEHLPEALIHLAAERKPDICENNHELTTAINVEASRRLARLSKQYNCWLLYMSTDYVFDGTQAPYKPDSTPNPLNFYGETKLKGELAVQEENETACILRVPVLYGYVEEIGESAITVICKTLLSSNSTKIDHWAKRFPTLVDDIGEVIVKMLKVKPAGVFHYSGNEAMTKYDIVRLMANVLGLSADHISGDPNEPGGAPRPQDCQLDVECLNEIGCYVEPRSIKDTIGGILKPHI